MKTLVNFLRNIWDSIYYSENAKYIICAVIAIIGFAPSVLFLSFEKFDKYEYLYRTETNVMLFVGFAALATAVIFIILELTDPDR